MESAPPRQLALLRRNSVRLSETRAPSSAAMAPPDPKAARLRSKTESAACIEERGSRRTDPPLERTVRPPMRWTRVRDREPSSRKWRESPAASNVSLPCNPPVAATAGSSCALMTTESPFGTWSPCAPQLKRTSKPAGAWTVQTPRSARGRPYLSSPPDPMANGASGGAQSDREAQGPPLRAAIAAASFLLGF
eukprot:scaffold18060_cov31-Tisochrysis_lutea.AAC.2